LYSCFTKLITIYCPTPKTRTIKTKSAISETDDLSPPAEVTTLIIEVSTIIAMIIRIMTMKTPVLLNFLISKI
jgi:hypothetical protein